MNLSARAFPSLADLIWRRTAFPSPCKPAALLPGNYCFTTNTESLQRILRRTDLPSAVLEKFDAGIYTPKGATLPAVELSEKTLTQIGYFID